MRSQSEEAEFPIDLYTIQRFFFPTTGVAPWWPLDSVTFQTRSEASLFRRDLKVASI